MTQGYCQIWIQIWKLKKQIQFNSFCHQIDDRKLTGKIIRENDAFEQMKKKPGLNLTLG